MPSVCRNDSSDAVRISPSSRVTNSTEGGSIFSGSAMLTENVNSKMRAFYTLARGDRRSLGRLVQCATVTIPAGASVEVRPTRSKVASQRCDGKGSVFPRSLKMCSVLAGSVTWGVLDGIDFVRRSSRGNDPTLSGRLALFGLARSERARRRNLLRWGPNRTKDRRVKFRSKAYARPAFRTPIPGRSTGRSHYSRLGWPRAVRRNRSGPIAVWVGGSCTVLHRS